MNDPCLLDEICKALGLAPMTRMVEVIERLRMLQYYYGQLLRAEMIANSANPQFFNVNHE